MSKEIARTVGVKRGLALLAILAAFTVFATVGYQWRDAKANTNGADYVITGASLSAGGGTTTGPVLNGATLWYRITGSLTMNAAGVLETVFTPPTGTVAVSALPATGPVPSCAVGSTVVCDYPANMASTTTFTLDISVRVSTCNDIDSTTLSGTADDASSQAPQAMTESALTTVTVLCAGALTKTPADTPVAAGGATGVVQTITFTNGNDALAAGNGNLVMTDAIPAGVSITAVAFGGTGTSNFPANCGATLPLAGPATLTCTSAAGGAVVASGQTVTVTVTQTVAAGVGVKTDTAGGTATYAAPLGTTSIGTAQATITQALSGALVHANLSPNDQALENQANDGGGALVGYDNSVSGNDVLDDAWNATGSLHTVCLVSPNLGLADNPNITWNILTTFGSANVFPIGGVKNVSTVNLTGTSTTLSTPVVIDADANCVQWRSSLTGAQAITATYVPTGTSFGWAGSGATIIPMIKEWNTIDSTKIVAVAGTVGTTLGGAISNTGDYDNYSSPTQNGDGTCNRDFNSGASPKCFNNTAVVDTSTTTPGAVATASISGTLFTSGPNSGLLNVTSTTAGRYLEYAVGSHSNGVGGPAGYNGPLDGVFQTYTVGGSCGSVRVENPVTGVADWLNFGQGVGHMNSDKGVGLQFFATSAAGVPNCRIGDTTTITITSREDVQLRSDLDDAPPETITITWTGPVPTNKQPILAWAGQRIVLEHDWRQPDGSCPTEAALIYYAKQAQGPGAFDANLPSGYLMISPDSAAVVVDPARRDRTTSNQDCISTALYESQDPGEVDIVSYGIQTGSGNAGLVPLTQEVVYLVYYMKLESVTVAAVDGARSAHNAGSFSPANPFDASKDKATVDSNVSKDVLARVRVKGWFTSANPSGRAAGTDSNGGGLPAGRWVMPDDWAALAGGSLAASLRPNYDIMISPAGSNSCTRTALNGPATCSSSTPLPGVPGGSSVNVGQTHGNVAGPFSLLDGPTTADSKAPLVGGGFRQTWLPDRVIDLWDAPMPPALVQVTISGSGYLKRDGLAGLANTLNGGADKLGIYATNPFYATHIPAEPWISQYNADGSGYLWNTWGSGLNSGLYDFWLDTAAVGSAVFSAQGKDLCKVVSVATDAACLGTSVDRAPGKVATGGFTSLKLYSDNHGEAMAYVNGDAGLTMDECFSAPKDDIVSISGVYCPKDALVGKTTVTANADYPDKRKHYPLAAATPLAINWKWGGIKSVTVLAGETPQFKYVVFHVKDRDGFCAIPTVQQTVTQITYPTGTLAAPSGTPTVETFPLYVRTSSSQAVANFTLKLVIIAPTSGGGVLETGTIPPYAGPAVPGVTVYQPTITNTGFPWLVATGTYSLHPVLGETVNYLIDSGDGRILNTSSGGPTSGTVGTEATTTTFDTADPSMPTKTKVEDGECQSWVRISNSLLGITNIMVTAIDPEGTVIFDKVIDLQGTTSYSLTFRWSLVTWPGANNVSVPDALKGTGPNDAGNDIFDQVTAVYGWDQAAQQWLAFFPSGVNVPGANDLTKLTQGSAYWIAIKAPGPTTWTIATNVG